MYRSRLQKLEERRNYRKAVLLTFVSLALIMMAIWGGIPLLIRLAVFLGDFNSSRRPIDKSDIIPPAPPQVIIPYEATNSANVSLRGWTEPGAAVYMTLNKNPIGSVVAKEDGGFIFSQIKLNEGINEFQAVAMDQAGNKSQATNPISVIYSEKKPNLEILNLENNQVIRSNSNRLEIKGKTDIGTYLTINNRVIIVSSEGNFVAFYNLNEGENTLSFVAKNATGGITTKELMVTFYRQ